MLGIFKDLSNEDYHANAAISRSGIKMFCESPYKYWANYLNPVRPKKKTTDAMELGSAFHTYILERDKFDEHYAIEPIKVLLKEVGRDAYDLYKKECEELEKTKKIVLSQIDMSTIYNMSLSLMKHIEARALIKDAVYEESYFWGDEHSGLMVKARPDILRKNCIVDLKTCASADSYTYQKTMVNDFLHVQGAMIREGVKQLTGNDIPTVVNICIEKTYPYAIGIKIISQSALDAGHMKFKNSLLDMKNCMAENKWQSYEPEEVDLPVWSK
jgi:hypothetical protein